MCGQQEELQMRKKEELATNCRELPKFGNDGEKLFEDVGVELCLN